MRFWYFWGRREAAARGDTGGLKAGMGGGFVQTCSVNSEMGTGELQFEHLTVGRICEIRSGAWVGRRSWAIRSVGA